MFGFGQKRNQERFFTCDKCDAVFDSAEEALKGTDSDTKYGTSRLSTIRRNKES